MFRMMCVVAILVLGCSFATADDYSKAGHQSAKENKPLMVYCGTAKIPAHKNPNTLYVHVDYKLEGYPANSIITCRPNGRGWIESIGTVDLDAPAPAPVATFSNCPNGQCGTVTIRSR